MGQGKRPGILNFLTAVLLALTALLAAGFVTINLFPDAAFNPLQPQAVAAASLVELPTAFVPMLADAPTEAPAEASPSVAPPTHTRTPRPTASPTRTPTKTSTPLLPMTPIATLVVIPTSGPSPTATWTRSPFAFTVQGDAPFALQNVFNTAGCNWMGVGGQVYDMQGHATLLGWVIHLEGGGLDVNSLSGTQPQYGPAGFEFKLSSKPKTTVGVYRLQLRDPQNTPVSDWVRLDTFDDCTKNVLVVNFLQNH